MTPEERRQFEAETERRKSEASLARAANQTAALEQEQGGGGFFRPDASTMQLASVNAGIMPGTTGGIGGAGSVVAPVDFGVASGIQSAFDNRMTVPSAGDIEAQVLKPLEDIHALNDSITQEYYGELGYLNDLASKAASAGFDITSPDVLNPQQMELTKRYREGLAHMQNLGNNLKNSHAVAEKMLADPSKYNTLNQGDDMYRYGDVRGVELDDAVAEFNKRTESYNTRAELELADAQYNQLVGDFDNMIAIAKEQNDLAEYQRLVKSRDALVKPKYDSTKQQELNIKADEAKTKKQAQWLKNRKAMKTQIGAINLLTETTRPFDPLQYTRNPDGTYTSDAFAGESIGRGKTIQGFEMEGYTESSPAYQDNIAAAEELKRTVKSYNQKNPNNPYKYTPDDKKLLASVKLENPDMYMVYTEEYIDPKTNKKSTRTVRKKVNQKDLVRKLVTAKDNKWGFTEADIDLAGLEHKLYDNQGNVIAEKLTGWDEEERLKLREAEIATLANTKEAKRDVETFLKNNNSFDLDTFGKWFDYMFDDYGSKKEDGTSVLQAKELDLSNIPALSHYGVVQLKGNMEDGEYTITDANGNPITTTVQTKEGNEIVTEEKEMDDLNISDIMRFVNDHNIMENHPGVIGKQQNLDVAKDLQLGREVAPAFNLEYNDGYTTTSSNSQYNTGGNPNGTTSLNKDKIIY